MTAAYCLKTQFPSTHTHTRISIVMVRGGGYREIFDTKTGAGYGRDGIKKQSDTERRKKNRTYLARLAFCRCHQRWWALPVHYDNCAEPYDPVG